MEREMETKHEEKNRGKGERARERGDAEGVRL